MASTDGDFASASWRAVSSAPYPVVVNDARPARSTRGADCSAAEVIIDQGEIDAGDLVDGA
jgi:hypothetical protein